VTTRARVRHERGVLDTDTLILLPRIQDDSLLPAEPLITTVTLAELSVGPGQPPGLGLECHHASSVVNSAKWVSSCAMSRP
jgi:hypothetical protein